MDVDTIIKIINGVGFPIFVSVWLLLRYEPIIKANTEATINMTQVMQKCIGPQKAVE